MGNSMPCGGEPSSNRSSPGGARGNLLSTNRSRFSSRSSGSLHGQGGEEEREDGGRGDHPRNSHSALPPAPPSSKEKKTKKSASADLPLCWRRPDHVTVRGGLRLRRPLRPRAILAFLQPPQPSSSTSCHHHQSASSKAAEASVRAACARLGVDVTPQQGGTTDKMLQTAQPALLSTAEAALEAFKDRPAHIVFVAGKQHQAEELARSIRQCVGGEHTVVVGIVKKSFLDRDDLSVASYLSAGFNRVLVESSSRGYWLNQLAMILATDVENNIRIQCIDTLLVALNNCRDIVQISDGEDRLLYGNSACERVLGFTSQDLFMRNTWDLQTTIGLTELSLAEEGKTPVVTGHAILRQRLEHGKSWEGPLNCRRKTGDYVPLDTRVIPIPAARISEHVVYIKQPPLLLRDGKSNANVTFDSGVGSHSNSLAMANRKSLKSFRNASCDVSAMMNEGHNIHHLGMRRQSAAKIHSLSVEAPITKVINIILAAQENSPQYIAQALDKVLDILQTTDSINLFSPEVERERKKHTDAVTTDLLGALLSQQVGPTSSSTLHPTASGSSLGRSSSVICRHQYLRGSFHRRRNSTRDVLSQRRSSTETSSISKGTGGLHQGSHTTHYRHSVPAALENSSAQLRSLLEKCDSWSGFDILELERLTEKRCLVWLGMTTLLRFEVNKTLKCSESTLQNWLTLIEANYNSSNAYHNSTHAADVMHAIAGFLESDKVKDYCDELDEAACLLAAVIHDVNHPGRNSAFLVNSRAELACLYNDITVLENHHAALGFKLTGSDERVDIFKELDRDSYKLMRQSIIDMVLATDMSKHFLHVNKFNSVFGRLVKDEDATSLSAGGGDTGLVHPGPNAIAAAAAATSSGSGDEADPDMVSLSEAPPNTPENLAILKRMLIKCADISNPARPLKLCKEWAFRIAEEYFSQTDDEKRLGLPVVMPQFDRTSCSIPKSQIGFYDFFITDMFTMLADFAEMHELTANISSNYSYWKQESEQEEEKKRKEEGSLREEEE